MTTHYHKCTSGFCSHVTVLCGAIANDIDGFSWSTLWPSVECMDCLAQQLSEDNALVYKSKILLNITEAMEFK